jgi:hypothetical protein
VVLGCGAAGPRNVVEDADKAKLAEYEQALADAEKIASQDDDFEK